MMTIGDNFNDRIHAGKFLLPGLRKIVECWRTISSRLAGAGLLMVLIAARPAKADYAVLRSGQRLHITAWQNLGDTVRLDLPGGSVTIAAADLETIEPEEVFGESAQREPDVPYSTQIRSAAASYGLDPALIASVIAVESNFNPRAVSKKSALGLMQLLPETAAQMAVPNAFDPAQNINGGTRYLKRLLDRYGQNLTLALAAYNAGPKRVDFYRGIPPLAETRSYIDRVMANLRSQPSLLGQFFSATSQTPLFFPPPKQEDPIKDSNEGW
jgi:soluble lytic murein transglycosylase-like protein